jgi:hypothetical protein
MFNDYVYGEKDNMLQSVSWYNGRGKSSIYHVILGNRDYSNYFRPSKNERDLQKSA